MNECWQTYLVRCADGSLYAGVSTNPQRRLVQHQRGQGARYTRAHGAVELAWLGPAQGKSAAHRLEARLKRLSRAGRERLISGDRALLDQLLAGCS